MKHGANIYKYAKMAECTPDEIIDFSSNINFYQPESELTLTNSLVRKYADSSYKELKEIIAKNYEIKNSQISLFNGATSAIYTLFSQLKQKRVYLYAPLYGEYEKAAIQSKKNIYKINRIANIEDEIQEKSIVVFVNPSTPEGTYYDLDELLKRWIELKCTIILDESFLEFEGLKSYRNKIKKYKKLYIIQSFSKFYSCAGVRIGAIFGCKKSIKKLQTPLWNLSSLDVEFLKNRLQDVNFKTLTQEFHKKQKLELQSILEESNLFEEIVESDTNFILTKSKKADELFRHLLKNKILVRTCGSFDYLSDEWLRFAVKDKDAHAKLKKALSEFS
jgi:threonine-phosphate decarboxylase